MMDLVDKVLASPFSMRILGAFMFVFANTIFAVVTGTYFYLIFGHRVNHFAFVTLVRSAIEIATGLTLLWKVLFNYFMAWIIPPGFAPSVAKAMQTDDREFSSVCPDCHSAQPIRSHHCIHCDKCILVMDHHCPWIGQCVGQNNHKHFLLFIFWLLVSAIYVLIVFLPVVYQINLSSPDPHVGKLGQKCGWLSVIMSASMIPTTSLLGGFHALLLKRNITSMEALEYIDSWSNIWGYFITGERRGPFPSRSWRQILRYLFSNSPLDYELPTLSR